MSITVEWSIIRPNPILSWEMNQLSTHIANTVVQPQIVQHVPVPNFPNNLSLNWALIRPETQLQWLVNQRIVASATTVQKQINIVQVLLGPKGDQGAQGPAGPPGPTGSLDNQTIIDGGNF